MRDNRGSVSLCDTYRRLSRLFCSRGVLARADRLLCRLHRPSLPLGVSVFRSGGVTRVLLLLVAAPLPIWSACLLVEACLASTWLRVHDSPGRPVRSCRIRLGNGDRLSDLAFLGLMRLSLALCSCLRVPPMCDAASWRCLSTSMGAMLGGCRLRRLPLRGLLDGASSLSLDISLLPAF